MQDNPLNEFTVDTNPQEMQPDDAAIGIPSTQEPEGATLEAVLGQQEAPKDGTQPNDQQPQGKQAGWINKRIEEGVNKRLQSVLAEERAKIAAEYDAKLKPIQDAMLSRDADDLVASGKVTSKEIALEYLRLKNGMPAAQQEPEKPALPARNDKGQFTQTNPTAPNDAEAYGQVLIAQVKAIEAASGVNVMDIYNADPEVKRRILSREWDFTDVYKHASGGNQPGGYQPTLPTPSRRPNGSGVASRPINEYSSEQFKKINDFLAQGGVIDLRT